MKKTLKRLLSVVLVVAVIATLFVGTTFAANSVSKKVTKTTSFSVTTGKGLTYSLGWKKTNVTIRNTGSGNASFSVFVDTGVGPVYKGDVHPGTSKSISLGGSNSKVTILCQKSCGNSTTAQITVSDGSVS